MEGSKEAGEGRGSYLFVCENRRHIKNIKLKRARRRRREKKVLQLQLSEISRDDPPLCIFVPSSATLRIFSLGLGIGIGIGLWSWASLRFRRIT